MESLLGAADVHDGVCASRESVDPAVLHQLEQSPEDKPAPLQRKKTSRLIPLVMYNSKYMTEEEIEKREFLKKRDQAEKKMRDELQAELQQKQRKPIPMLTRGGVDEVDGSAVVEEDKKRKFETDQTGAGWSNATKLRKKMEEEDEDLQLANGDEDNEVVQLSQSPPPRPPPQLKTAPPAPQQQQQQ